MSHQRAARSGCPAAPGEELDLWCRRSHLLSSILQSPETSTGLVPPETHKKTWRGEKEQGDANGRVGSEGAGSQNRDEDEERRRNSGSSALLCSKLRGEGHHLDRLLNDIMSARCFFLKNSRGSNELYRSVCRAITSKWTCWFPSCSWQVRTVF